MSKKILYIAIPYHKAFFRTYKARNVACSVLKFHIHYVLPPRFHSMPTFRPLCSLTFSVFLPLSIDSYRFFFLSSSHSH
jgi:hypothetical protein